MEHSAQRQSLPQTHLPLIISVVLSQIQVGALGGRTLNRMLARNKKLQQLLLAGNEVEFQVLKEMECKIRDNRTRARSSMPTPQLQVDLLSTNGAVDPSIIHSLDTHSLTSPLPVPPDSRTPVHHHQPSNLPGPSPISMERDSVEAFSMVSHSHTQTSPISVRRSSTSTGNHLQPSNLPEPKFDNASTDLIMEMIKKMLAEGFSESRTHLHEWVQHIHHSV